MAQAKVNTTAFSAMCHQLAGLAAAKYEDVLKAEVGRVLEKALEYTPALKVAKVRSRYDTAIISAQPSTLYTPKRPRRAKLTKNGYVQYFLANRYPNELWAAISARRKERLARIIGARGLAKQSWQRIANALGITIKAPGYAATAVASTGKTYADVSATENTSSESTNITISNGQPTVNNPQVGGERALKRAISGRIKFFQQNAEKAVFADVAKIAKAYPGMKVNPRDTA